MPEQDSTNKATAPGEPPGAEAALRSPRPQPAPAAPPVLSRVPVKAAELPASTVSGAPAPAGAPAAAAPELLRAETLRLALASHGEALRSGAAVDRAAVEAVLGQADQVLAELGARSAALPKQERAGFAAARAALLDAAFALTATLQQLVPAESVPAKAPPPPRPPAAAPASAAEHEFQPVAVRPGRRGKVLAGFAAVSLLAAAGFHGTAYVERRQGLRNQAQVLPGTPEGLSAVRQPDGRVLLMPQAGRRPDPEQFERFKAAQAERGWKLEELGQGAWMVQPEPARQR